MSLQTCSTQSFQSPKRPEQGCASHGPAAAQALSGAMKYAQLALIVLGIVLGYGYIARALLAG